jgi:hypothetical protein
MLLAVTRLSVPPISYISTMFCPACPTSRTSMSLTELWVTLFNVALL